MFLRKLLLSCLTVLLMLGSLAPTSLLAEGGIKNGLTDGEILLPDNTTNPSVSDNISEPSPESFEPPALPEEQTVTESVYRASLAVEKTELVIHPGESVQFTNGGSISTSITTDAKSSNEIRYDYVAYNAEGKAVYDDLARSGSATVTKGGTTVITADYGYSLTVSFNTTLTYSYSTVPALLKKTLFKGDSYLFSNQALAPRSITSDVSSTNLKRYDYAIYRNDNSLESSSFDAFAKPSFSVGDTIILTGASDSPVTVAVPYEGFYGYETDEPAYDSVLLYPGQSYKFTNVGTKSDRVEHSGTTKDKFDYVVYAPDGTETSRGTNTSSLPLVGVGKYVVFTLITENPVRVGAPYRSFMGGNRQDDAISRVTLSPGNSYKFTNHGSLVNPVNNNAREVTGRYDYTIYKADGTYSSQGFDSISVPQIPAGGFVIITVQGTSSVTFDYTDDFSAIASDEPSHFRVTLSQGQSYEFKNISPSARYLRTNATSSNRFDWVEYYPDGTQHSKRENTYSDTQVSSGNSIVVTALSAPVTFGANYRLFSWKDKPGEAISKQNLHLEESYMFTNTGSKLITLSSDALQVGGKFDVAVYDRDGSVHIAQFDETGNVAIPAGGYAIVTGQSSNPVNISYTDTITVSTAEHPALLRASVTKGYSYTYENISNETENLFSDATSGTNEFAYVLRRPDGTILREEPSRHTTVQVPAGHSITVAPLTATVTFGGIYTSFKGTPGDNPTVKQVTLHKNESYLFTNQLTSPQTLTSNASEGALSMFDYVMYGADDKPEEAKLNQDGNLSVSKGSQVVVTVVTDQPVTFTYGQAFQASPSGEPAFLKRTLEPKKTAIAFKNKSSYEAKLTTDASTAANKYYDFMILDQSGALVKQGERNAFSYGVPAGGKIQVRTTSVNPVVFAAPYRVFELAETQEYVFEELQHRQRLFVNKASGESGYYRFVAPESGRYRFVTMEMNSFTQEPVLTLFNGPDLQESVGSSEQSPQEFGMEYTVLETTLEAGQTVYLKLMEKKGLPLNLQLTVTILKLAPETKLQYTQDGKLLQMTFPSGDVLIYEYDPNGNLKRRVKKVYPF